MTQQIIKNLNTNKPYTLPQQYTTVVGGAGIVDAAAGKSFITITSGGAYLDYLMTILFRNNTGIQVPKVYILLISNKSELVSIVSFYRLSDTELVLNVGKVLSSSVTNGDLCTVQIDAQYSSINIQSALYTGYIALLDQANIELTAAIPPSFNNNSAGGPPMAISGEAVTVAITGGGGDRTSVDPLPPSLALEWDNIDNALRTTVGDYNIDFSSDFVTLHTIGNTQYLIGNSVTFEFPTVLQGNTSIVKITDTANSISLIRALALRACTALTSVSLPACTSVGVGAFDGCTALTSVSFPVCTSVDPDVFNGCTGLTSVNLPLCEKLGGTVYNDNVFKNIAGQTITLTIAASRATCNAGGPDGDIAALAASNTATINYV